MFVEDLKWYSPIVLFVGAILSFADPITDILTLVEFYRADHKTWFGVGLVFVILPCLVFPILFFLVRDEYSGIRKCAQTILCGVHPFSAAFVRLQAFIVCLRKWWRGDEIDSADEAADDLLGHIFFAVLFESVLESAPQFIIQLYAASVQEEPVEVIQIISLPVSFLSLAWAFTTADMFMIRAFHKKNSDDLKIKHKFLFFITHLFLLSSRLFAVCYFTVSYKWWVIGVLFFHNFVIMTADNISYWLKGQCELRSLLISCVHSLRDDFSEEIFESSPDKTAWRRVHVLSNVLFIVENFVMILVFYFSQHSSTWYSLPVTVCVCVFSCLGCVMRLIIYHRVITKE